ECSETVLAPAADRIPKDEVVRAQRPESRLRRAVLVNNRSTGRQEYCSSNRQLSTIRQKNEALTSCNHQTPQNIEKATRLNRYSQPPPRAQMKAVEGLSQILCRLRASQSQAESLPLSHVSLHLGTAEAPEGQLRVRSQWKNLGN